MRRGADEAEKKDAQPSKWALSTGRMPREATRDPQTQLREDDDEDKEAEQPPADAA